jgi:hypothetical protein
MMGKPMQSRQQEAGHSLSRPSKGTEAQILDDPVSPHVSPRPKRKLAAKPQIGDWLGSTDGPPTTTKEPQAGAFQAARIELSPAGADPAESMPVDLAWRANGGQLLEKSQSVNQR